MASGVVSHASSLLYSTHATRLPRARVSLQKRESQKKTFFLHVATSSSSSYYYHILIERSNMDNPAYVCSPNDEQGKPSYNSSSLTIPPASTCNNNIVKSNGNHEHQHEQLTPRWQSVGAGKEEEEEQDASMTPARCGIFFWKPDCLQRFPTKRWFIAVFLLATTIKGMSGSYFPSTISSVEKRLKVSTETIGTIIFS